MFTVNAQVFDDFNLLHKIFPNAFCDVIREMSLYSKPQVIVLSSFCSEELALFMKEISDPVVIITCAIEATIRANVYLVSFKNCFGVKINELLHYQNLFSSGESKIEVLMNEISEGEGLVVCASSQEEAESIYQV